MNDFVEMKVTGLSIDPFTSMPIVILKDESGVLALPIWLGLMEASAIANEIDALEISRPMTHDVLADLIAVTKTKVLRAEIYDLRDNIFYACLHLELYDQKDLKQREERLECRPSDAITLALKTKVKIKVNREIIAKARQIENDTTTNEQKQSQKWAEVLESLTPDDFGKYKM